MSATAGVFLEAGDFALGRCSECRREVLTYPDNDSGLPGVRRCLHCDERLATPAEDAPPALPGASCARAETSSRDDSTAETSVATGWIDDAPS